MLIIHFFTIEQQIADQKKRKEKEKEKKVDWWELRKAPDTEFNVSYFHPNILYIENCKGSSPKSDGRAVT